MKVLESELKGISVRIRAAERERRMKGGRLEVEVSKLYPPQIFGEVRRLRPRMPFLPFIGGEGWRNPDRTCGRHRRHCSTRGRGSLGCV